MWSDLSLFLDTHTYQFEEEELVVSGLFEMLDSVQDQIGIVDWGIKITKLKDGRNIIPLLHLWWFNAIFLPFSPLVKMDRDLCLQIDGSLCPSWLPCSGCFHRPSTEWTSYTIYIKCALHYIHFLLVKVPIWTNNQCNFHIFTFRSLNYILADKRFS